MVAPSEPSTAAAVRVVERAVGVIVGAPSRTSGLAAQSIDETLEPPGWMTLGVPDDGPNHGTIDPGSGPEDQNTLDMRDQPKVLASEIDSAHERGCDDGIRTQRRCLDVGSRQPDNGHAHRSRRPGRMGIRHRHAITTQRASRSALYTADGERDRSRQVLDERYARGEMTTDEYNERRQTLAQ